MSHWEIRIDGEERALALLAQDFPEGNSLAITHYDGAYFMRDARLDALADVAEVRAKLPELLALISGILRCTLGSREPIRDTRVIHRLRDDGGRDIFVMAEGGCIHITSGVVSLTVTADGVTTVVPPPPPRTVILEGLSRMDVAVAKALRLIGQGDLQTWTGMYRLLEHIEGDCGSVVDREWSGETQRSRFRHTAGSVAAAGDQARHGRETTQPPPKPMSIDEASAYLTSIFEAWLASKG